MAIQKSINSSIILSIAIVLGSCNALQTFTSMNPSPREKYVNALTKTGLLSSSLAQTWMNAGDVALHDSIIVTLPFRETGYFASSEPSARFYRFDVKDGQVLTLTSAIKAKEKSKLFIDVFLLKENKWETVAYSDSLSLTYELPKSGSCIVRLQPELLVNIYYSITLSVTPVLMNPVKGASNKSIGSFYGDPRDGGKRKHEGIDIFAPKGTFVIAPTDGVVTRVSSSVLGGKTVWMNDTKRGHSYYFAHLDSQIAIAGRKVKQGDVLGTVGNTGNAITTPSHLHFGVFQNKSINPIAYIRTMEKLVNELAPDTSFQSIVFRTKQKITSIHSGPSTKLAVRESLSKDYYVRVIGQSGDWYRVSTANNREGFIEKSKVITAEKGNKFVIRNPASLLTEADSQAVPIGTVTGTAEGLASYKQFRYIKTSDGLNGWIDITLL
ncbi:MAG: M23 family metallopeptidase [Cyclobacteriaceae bacterium]|nr:M23 family metallopeptidase [Cyclobacteriaceae bacterium]